MSTVINAHDYVTTGKALIRDGRTTNGLKLLAIANALVRPARSEKALPVRKKDNRPSRKQIPTTVFDADEEDDDEAGCDCDEEDDDDCVCPEPGETDASHLGRSLRSARAADLARRYLGGSRPRVETITESSATGAEYQVVNGKFTRIR